VSDSLMTSYQHAISDSYWARGQLDYFWSGTQAAYIGDPHAFYGPDQHLGARFTVGPQQGAWETSLWAKNLTNNNATTHSSVSFYGGYTVYRQMPRTYGVDFRYRFH
jgi:hypothetical protein